MVDAREMKKILRIMDMNIKDAKAHILCIQTVFIRLQLIKT